MISSLYVKELVCVSQEMCETGVNLKESNIFYSNMVEWKYMQNGGTTNELKHKTVYFINDIQQRKNNYMQNVLIDNTTP